MSSVAGLRCSEGAPNPDIVGIGVRAAFYAQTLLLLFISILRLKQESQNAVRVAVITKLCLVLSALVQYKTEQGLSVMDGLMVSALVLMQDYILIEIKLVDMSLYLFGFIRSAGGKKILPAGLILFSPHGLDHLLWSISSIVAQGWGIFVWARVRMCGSRDLFVLLGWNFHLTNNGLQIFMLCYVGFFTLVILAQLLVIIIFNITTRGGRKLPGSCQMDSHKRDEIHVYWLEAYNQKKFWPILGKIVFFVTGFCYWAVCLLVIEQTIRHNGMQAALSPWTFGQALAVSVVFSSVWAAAYAVPEALKDCKCRFTTIRQGSGAQSQRVNSENDESKRTSRQSSGVQRANDLASPVQLAYNSKSWGDGDDDVEKGKGEI
ncbi:hypothetical protein FRC09_015575 [Ceratobasidium sp. 395]|nr:hypothetical protein FRC09_015575 [Ceratobasidium sp. 395]